MKILVIEDDAEIIEFISIAFDIGWPGVELVSTHQGNTGLELVETEAPDAVILDLGLPDISGFDVLKQIRAFSEVPVIIVSVRGSEADIVKGLDWGADEYILKPFGQLELLARVKAVLRRTSGRDVSDCVSAGSISLNTVSSQFSCRNKSVLLTHTESLIVHSLIVNAGQVVTYPQLAEAVWGDTYPDATDALRVYIRRIRAKIEPVIEGVGRIDSRPGVGYIFDISR
ncbi:MAG: DNA-binding response regulator [Dehalococcoidia bacterium]|nr:MAG: DNA-binding response regulator [Dehalococcoidia bacterium]